MSLYCRSLSGCRTSGGKGMGWDWWGMGWSNVYIPGKGFYVTLFLWTGKDFFFPKCWIEGVYRVVVVEYWGGVFFSCRYLLLFPC
jgi:hypothetical protein